MDPTSNSAWDYSAAHLGGDALPWVVIVLGVLVLLLLVPVLVVYAWPLRNGRLRHALVESLDHDDAVARATEIVTADRDDPDVAPEAGSMLLTHGTRTAKAVLMLHGYTVSPAQYANLARFYFDHGYNVYVPRAPGHGLVDRRAEGHLRAIELVGYANESINIAAGLGEEVGVVGISGGAVLGTWLAQYRSDVVRRLLVLAPFYRVNPAKAPGYLIKPLTVLFGFRILPDRQVTATGFWISALSQYLRITINLKALPGRSDLRTVAVAFSENDESIDQRAAVELPRRLADANDLPLRVHRLARELGLGHDIVRPERVNELADELDQLYLDLYEGRAGLADVPEQGQGADDPERTRVTRTG
ncbi:alpha/beta hydrolase [Micromonospora sp. NBC_01796]|uniref:alpha/beta hydrolase n=1 Tax=Micromonospora sp. NBC_01796 TaxID=2975987 RepID=UPI002DDB9BE8|nr:alpha/beta fold hydrolase [Micromonospora sp. NBC_01796]WSA84356.1 alpha/beta hydrolase [Micromonospora sp. NBC_01796]